VTGDLAVPGSPSLSPYLATPAVPHFP